MLDEAPTVDEFDRRRPYAYPNAFALVDRAEDSYDQIRVRR
jgi:hypothetical protein